MRAIEIPRILFEEIIERTSARSYKIDFGGVQSCLFIFLEENQAIVGYGKNKTYWGRFSFVNVWNFCFKPDFKPVVDLKPDIFFRDTFPNPCLRIAAGPFSNGIWSEGLGYSLTEKVIAKYNYEIYDFTSSGLFSDLIYNITKLTEDLVSKNLKQFNYWEKFINPNGDYTRKPQ